MVVTGSPSTTQAFVGYTGSLITTETVTQTFTDKLVRGTRTTVDDVMTSSIRTSTLPVVTTMTTREGELSTEVVTTEDQEITLLVTTNTTTIVVLVEDGIATTTVATVTLTSTDTSVRMGVYTTTTVYLPSGENHHPFLFHRRHHTGVINTKRDDRDRTTIHNKSVRGIYRIPRYNRNDYSDFHRPTGSWHKNNCRWGNSDFSNQNINLLDNHIYDDRRR